MIEAGTAFGSGGHPSTALALWLMGQLPPDLHPAHILDVGCGSGILSVAAALRWGTPVLASDLAAPAVAQTQANAEANGVGALVTTVHADGCRHPEITRRAPYDLILCNMLADLHIMLARDLAALCAPQGNMLLSGILRWRMPELLTYYAALGFHPVLQETEGDWAALVLSTP